MKIKVEAKNSDISGWWTIKDYTRAESQKKDFEIVHINESTGMNVGEKEWQNIVNVANTINFYQDDYKTDYLVGC